MDMAAYGRFPGISRALLIATVQAPPTRSHVLRHSATIHYVIIH